MQNFLTLVKAASVSTLCAGVLAPLLTHYTKERPKSTPSHISLHSIISRFCHYFTLPHYSTVPLPFGETSGENKGLRAGLRDALAEAGRHMAALGAARQGRLLSPAPSPADAPALTGA